MIQQETNFQWLFHVWLNWICRENVSFFFFVEENQISPSSLLGYHKNEENSQLIYYFSFFAIYFFIYVFLSLALIYFLQSASWTWKSEAKPQRVSQISTLSSIFT